MSQLLLEQTGEPEVARALQLAQELLQGGPRFGAELRLRHDGAVHEPSVEGHGVQQGLPRRQRCATVAALAKLRRLQGQPLGLNSLVSELHLHREGDSGRHARAQHGVVSRGLRGVPERFAAGDPHQPRVGPEEQVTGLGEFERRPVGHIARSSEGREARRDELALCSQHELSRLSRGQLPGSTVPGEREGDAVVGGPGAVDSERGNLGSVQGGERDGEGLAARVHAHDGHGPLLVLAETEPRRVRGDERDVVDVQGCGLGAAAVVAAVVARARRPAALAAQDHAHAVEPPRRHAPQQQL